MTSTSLALTLSACSSGSAGSNGVSSVSVTDSQGTTGTTGGTEFTASVTDTEDDSSAEGTSSTTDESTTTGQDGTSSSSTTAPAGTPAVLEWTIDQPIVNFGDIPVDGAASNVIVLENVGGFAATSLSTGTIPGDFSFPGGYPGTGGTCGTELEGGETCLLELRFGPTRVGPVESSLAIEYYDGINLGAPTETEALTLRGGGQGESANLLINGDAETGELQPWSVPAGLANWTTTNAAFGGSFAFTPTGAIVVTALDQAVDLSPWQDETSVVGLRYRVRARARSNSGEHNYRVYVDLGDGFLPLINGAETAWTLVQHIDDVPVDATAATVRIECANNMVGAGPCNVSLDDVTLQAVYP